MEARYVAALVKPREDYIRAMVEGRTDEPYVKEPRHMQNIRQKGSGQMALSVDEAGKVPIVIDDAGTTMYTADASESFGVGGFYDPDAPKKKKGGGRRAKRVALQQKERERGGKSTRQLWLFREGKGWRGNGVG
ncbi:hypothetical protein AAF712_014109 [Marasmius tenuissimus]|uniref:Uncharacterized protein n=1 Tax=Marasmius tenuissimus TaxID=585030 RepID=A0ABR2ZDX4_9AGAR